MITSNTSIPFIKSENSENKFYLSRLTSEYNEGDSITTSTAINCRKLAIAIKAGDKITINGTSLTVYADAAVDATSFFVEEITLDEALNINANIAIDEDNMFVQYQRKTEGTVAGFDIDADGMSKGGVEITGWLDSDTMEGATENNIPTAQSVKAYVDGQAGHSETLQEVTDNGNTTTNSIMIGSSSSPDTKLEVEGSENGVRFTRAASTNQHISFYTDSLAVGNRIESTVKHFEIKQLTENKDILLSVESGEAMRITSAGKVGIGTTSPSYPLEVAGADSVGIDDYIIHNGDGNTKFGFPSNDKFKVRTAGTDALTIDSSQNVGIGTTSPDTYLQIEDLGSTNTEVDLKVTNTNGSARFGTQSGYSRFWTNDKLKYAVSETVHIWYNDTGTVSMKMDYTGNLLIATTTDSGYKLDVNGTQRVQDVLELDDVLTLNAISTPDDPTDGKSSIYMDSADGNIKVKINVGGEVVTRTIASYDG